MGPDRSSAPSESSRVRRAFWSGRSRAPDPRGRHDEPRRAPRGAPRGRASLRAAGLARAAAPQRPRRPVFLRPDCDRAAGKHPRSAHGVRDASVDEAVVRAWWARWPDANLGLATGSRQRPRRPRHRPGPRRRGVPRGAGRAPWAPAARSDLAHRRRGAALAVRAPGIPRAVAVRRARIRARRPRRRRLHRRASEPASFWSPLRVGRFQPPRRGSAPPGTGLARGGRPTGGDAPSRPRHRRSTTRSTRAAATRRSPRSLARCGGAG